MVGRQSAKKVHISRGYPTMKPNKASHISKCSAKSEVYQTAGNFCINLWRFEKSKMASKMAAVF